MVYVKLVLHHFLTADETFPCTRCVRGLRRMPWLVRVFAEMPWTDSTARRRIKLFAFAKFNPCLSSALLSRRFSAWKRKETYSIRIFLAVTTTIIHRTVHVALSACMQPSEATKFVMGYIVPSETMRIWNLSAPTRQQFNCTTLGSLTSPREKNIKIFVAQGVSGWIKIYSESVAKGFC